MVAALTGCMCVEIKQADPEASRPCTSAND